YFPKKLPPREIKRYKSPAGSPHPSDSRGFPASPSATFPAGEGYKTSRYSQTSQARKFLKVWKLLSRSFHDLNSLLTFKRPLNVKKL
ncbi:MAG: hypothetical protein J5885_00090, partial [Clostridia bacterium]|nr:hypothetical protein [Clostridia bacterium]